MGVQDDKKIEIERPVSGCVKLVHIYKVFELFREGSASSD